MSYYTLSPVSKCVGILFLSDMAIITMCNTTAICDSFLSSLYAGDSCDHHFGTIRLSDIHDTMNGFRQLLRTTILYFSNVVFLIIQNVRNALHSAHSKKISEIDRLARLKYLFDKRLLFPKAHGRK